MAYISPFCILLKDDPEAARREMVDAIVARAGKYDDIARDLGMCSRQVMRHIKRLGLQDLCRQARRGNEQLRMARAALLGSLLS